MGEIVPTLEQFQRVVVKIGSALLVDSATGALRTDWLESLVSDIADLHHRGMDVIVVSSGSIALGRMILELSALDVLPLESSQAAAAVGQIRLASAYASAFDHYGINVAQILLTLDDSKDRKRYLNGCATLQALIERRVIPIVNENDTVATDEICYGDNDRLAARIALMTKADALILLSDVDGLYTADPYKNPKAEHIALVDDVNQDIILMAGAGVSKFSKGGMITKLLAARTVTRSGCTMAIAQGKTMNSLQGFGKDKLCTWFLPKTNPHDARKKWIAGMKFLGTVLIDQGAAEALKNGRSLLPVGVVNVEGDFQKGDPVTIADCHQNIVGAALTRHSSEAIKKLIGCKSSEIPERLGYPGCAVVAHRDDLVLWSG